MKTTQKLRADADKLEAKIKEAVDEFIEESGECDININVDSIFQTNLLRERYLLNTDVKVYVTV